LLGYSLCIESSSSIISQLSPIQNSNLFLISTWDQFKSLKEFAACIVKSDQINISYFASSCSNFVQKLPKFQQFIKSKAIDLPRESLCNIIMLPFPLTRPLQLLYQRKFWEELLVIYFKEYHPINPLFSIQSFDHKTASPTLLNAMYYCAYQFSKQRPNEITEYMDKLASQNVKKIVKNATIDNIRALIMHTFIAQYNGKLDLAKSLHAHLSRMSYLLGLHLNYNKISPVDRYNRDILFCMARICEIRLSASYKFSPNYLTDFKKPEPHLYDIKWQLPDSNSLICSMSEIENELYSRCTTIYFNFLNISTNIAWFPSFFKLKSNDFHKSWTYRINKLKYLYESTAETLKDLIDKHYLYKDFIASFEIHLKMIYYEALIEMYEILKQRNKILQPSEVSIILEYCHGLYHVLFIANNHNPYFEYFAHFIGLHYLNIYPKCSTLEKQRTKQRLLDLLLFMKDRLYSYFTLNYLILKTGYDSLDGN
jgi:hypothetical protein